MTKAGTGERQHLIWSDARIDTGSESNAQKVLLLQDRRTIMADKDKKFESEDSERWFQLTYSSAQELIQFPRLSFPLRKKKVQSRDDDEERKHTGKQNKAHT